MDVFDLVAKITLDNSSYTQSLEDAGTKSNNLVSQIKNGFKTIVTGAAIVAVGKQIYDLGKQAVDAYADYQQLVGGVDTLFKESSAKVQEYAANAYKTAGMSANDYMETVTSFSASLLQSLGGDTETAAESANQALTDMSDNANKMGTSMDSIQVTYQGFAKQNYTMLDNLKLGYGGTQSEMKRLLSDAEKLTGQKYDITNLNDVYSAIHAVQTEMGITGTTAKEAADTISGSVSMMKSSWTNFLTGLANPDADLDELSAQLIESVGIVAKNVLPAIVTTVGSMIGVVGSAIIDGLPKLAEKGAELIDKFAASIQENGIRPDGELIKSIGAVLEAILKAIVAIAPSLLNLGVVLIEKLASGIYSAASGALKKAINNVEDTIKSAFDDLVSGALDWGKDLISNFIDGINQKWKDLKSTVSNAAQVVKDFLGFSEPTDGPLSNFHTYAPDMMKLFAQGVKDNTDVVTDQIAQSFDFGTKTVDFASSAQGIASSGIVNGLASTTQSGFAGSIAVNLILDGKTLASTTINDFIEAAKQQGTPIANAIA